MIHFYLSIAYFAGAVWYYSFSGMAEGLTPPRLLSIPIFAAALGHSLYVLALIIMSVFNKSVRRKTGHYAVLAGLAANLISYELGNRIDNQRIELSMNRGDEIIAEIRQFKSDNGRCPANLEELRQRGVVLPEPALKMSKYRYWIDKSGECNLSFDSILFMTCSKSLDHKDWHCDD